MMNLLELLKIKKQIFKEKELDFISFLEEKKKYRQYFRFLFVYSKITKEVLYSMFEGLLKEILIIEFDQFTMVIYHNKERVILNNYLDALSEDYGYKINVFEGFLIDKDQTDFFKDFLILYYQNYQNNLTYSTISNLILNTQLKKEELKIFKKILLSKYLKEIQFEKFIFSLFENNLNVSKTAKDMYMHRNTVNNKLANFENDTTLVLQNFKDAIVVYELLK